MILILVLLNFQFQNKNLKISLPNHEKLNNVAFRKWIKEKFSCQGFEVYKWETQKSFRVQLDVFAHRNNRFDCNELVRLFVNSLVRQS